MNIGQIRELVYSILQDEQGERWPTEVVTTFLDEAHREFLAKTGMDRDSATLVEDTARTPDNAFYTLPADCLRLDRLVVNGIVCRRRELADMHEGWEADTGTSTGYLLGPWGYDTIRLDLIPSASATVTAYYTASATALSDASTPRIPEAFHPALAYFAVARCYLMDLESKDPQKAGVFQQLYAEGLRQAGSYAEASHDGTDRIVPYRHL